MPEYLFRIDAVNLFANAVGDCQQLSVLRGGGLMLLDAVRGLPSLMGGKAISNGSSSLLCSVDCADPVAMQEKVERYLNDKEEVRRHGTFAVSYVLGGGDFAKQSEKLTARNRWRQMQSASVAVPAAGNRGECKVDLVRPATVDLEGHHGMASESAADRFRYGRRRKQEFYKEYSGVQGLSFAEDLNELSKGGTGNLDGKIALIHVDGNGFGKRQRACASSEALTKWDKFIQDERRKALTAILEAIRIRDEWKNGNDIRLETLLWGGDESIWVTPAWCGWALLEKWFAMAQHWKFAQPLTHAGGIVFCHHKAPIHRIRDLAVNLTEAVKDHTRDRNAFTYQVLESFDHIGRDLDTFRIDLSRHFGGKSGLVLDASQLAALREAAKQLRGQSFPRSKAIDMARTIADGRLAEAAAMRKRIDWPPGTEAVFEQLSKALGDPMAWLHLAELWDYLPAEGAL